jgi:UPF0271 protein
MKLPGWVPLGDGAHRAPLPDGADPAAVLAALRAWPGVRDAVVTDAFAAIYGEVASLPPLAAGGERVAGRAHEVMVRYDGADLAELAARAGLSVAEVVRRHAATAYRVLFLGFLPGFGYLGDVDPPLRAPRRASPRARVPAGAVGIAGKYTAIYPHASPGGWNLVGTAVGFSPWEGERATLSPGDTVTFVATR